MEQEPKLRRGDLIEVEVAAIGRRGISSARSDDGREFLVPRGVPGERALVRFRGRTKSGLATTKEATLRPSPRAAAPRCALFGTCGGCTHQDLAYEAQLDAKREAVRAALARAGLEAERVEAVLPSAEPYGYRNKMDFSFGSRRFVLKGEADDVDTSFALGLHVPGRYEKILDVLSCPIAFPGADALLGSTRAIARSLGLSAWDVKRHAGLLRHLVLRRGVRTGETMVDLVTSEPATEAMAAFAAAMREAHPWITTLVQHTNRGVASVAIGELEHLHFGPGTITEIVLGLRCTISPHSFFQTNTLQAERLFAAIVEAAGEVSGKVVHDLYCGAGVIGLLLARQARAVVGFEVVAAAITDAERNARDNGIGNARFVLGDVLAAGDGERAAGAADVVVVDPPRAGLHPKVLARLIALRPPRLVYVSCNVDVAGPALARLVSEAGYRLARVVPLDLFPHTPHVECVFTLELPPAATASRGPGGN